MVKVLFPPPETPVTQVKVPTGISPVTPFRLLPRAPVIFSRFLPIGRRFSGTGTSRSPMRYWPVMESFDAMMSAGVPSAITSPPWTPAAGPMSITWSAVRMASSSCSTTSTELPRSRNSLRLFSRRVLSRWCSPMEGSSSTYSPPESVPDARAMDR